MKYVIVSFLFFLLVSCRKSLTPDASPSPFAATIKNQLQERVSENVFSMLSLDTLFSGKENGTEFIRIGFLNKRLDQQFILVQVDSDGNILNGRIVQIDHGINESALHGNISIQGLDGGIIIDKAPIRNGYIRWKTPTRIDSNTLVQPGVGKVLPEVIITSQKSKPSSTWYLLQALAGSGGSGTTSGYYSSASGGGSTTNPSGGAGSKADGAGKSGGTAVKETEVVLVDFEFPGQEPAVDIEKMIKCFSLIPDANAVCSIEIFADIPVDSDPNKLFDWKTNSPGHTFIQLKKRSGNSSIMQNIGFYPMTDYKSLLTPAPVGAKFVDNSNHEFNASLKMNLSLEGFKTVLTRISYLAKFVKYDIDEYNCTDFALEIFNVNRRTKLEIPKIDIPSAQAPSGSNTPQGLYMKLIEMVKSRDPESGNITSNIIKGYPGVGNGPCN